MIRKDIVFTKMIDRISDHYFPQPSSFFLPEWYKKTDNYTDIKKNITQKNETNGTIKKCIPIFDALTSGYIIPTYCDLIIKKDENGNRTFTTPIDTNIEFHSVEQAPYHPKASNQMYPKWINPWGIKTPKGYSSLFIPPLHSLNEYFSILPGLVDTDKYNYSVNFPFVLNDPNFEGLIPAGTPMALVIPIKRDNWKSISGSNIERIKIFKQFDLLSSIFFDRYKNLFWEKKVYK